MLSIFTNKMTDLFVHLLKANNGYYRHLHFSLPLEITCIDMQLNKRWKHSRNLSTAFSDINHFMLLITIVLNNKFNL